MSAESSRAVFLSYASQNAKAALRYARGFEFGVLGLGFPDPQSAIRDSQ